VYRLESSLRIGHFISHFPEPGSVATVVLGLGSALVSQGHPVFVYGCGGQPSGAGDLREAVLGNTTLGGLVSRVFPPPRLRFPVPVPIPAMGRLTEWLSANQDHIDLLVVHGTWGVFSTGVANACRRGQIPYVVCPHNPYSPEMFGRRGAMKWMYWLLLESKLLQGAEAIHIMAPSHERYLRDRGIDTPAFVVPNGLDREFLDEARRNGPSRHTSKRDALRLLYYGRWDIYHKGLDLLLKGLARARASGLGVTLQIAGKASQHQRSALYELVTSLRLREAVSFEGFIDPLHSSHVRDADFVVLTSRFEGFALIVIEALAVGTPVIVSSKAGAAEFFDASNGVFVVEPDPASVAASFELALRERAQMRKAAVATRSVLEDGFTWDTLAHRWIREVGAVIQGQS
jgi:glycosyltransferase involved in cell wall biosynthesis